MDERPDGDAARIFLAGPEFLSERIFGVCARRFRGVFDEDVLGVRRARSRNCCHQSIPVVVVAAVISEFEKLAICRDLFQPMVERGICLFWR